MTTPQTYQAIERSTTVVLTDAFWDVIEKRIDFLDDLVKMKREHEALTLCVVYIDGVADSLAPPGTKVGPAFCMALAAHETAPYFSVIHPLQMIRAATGLKGLWQGIAAKLTILFPGPTYTLMSQLDFLTAVVGTLVPDEAALLKSEAWRGTIAAIVYGWIRNPSVHELGGSRSVVFDSTTYQGQTVTPLSLSELVTVLRRMTTAARANAHASGKIR